MIEKLLFLILAMLASALTPDNPNWWALAVTYSIIIVQAYTLKHFRWAATLVQLELILYIALFHGNSVGAVFEYLAGLALFHGIQLGPKEAWKQTRFLAPFSVPFIGLYTIGLITQDDWVSLGLTLLLLVAMSIGMAPFLIYCWGCPSLPDGELRERLEKFCQRIGFRCADFRVWTLLPNALTAAILGLIAPLRYIIFTPRILQTLSPNAIEAIVAHEIGHYRRKHLILYPFIMIGAVIVGSLLFDPFLDSEQGLPLWANFAYLLLIALYFRFVFGYFSRLFERQADLHVFECGIPPEHLIEALDQVGHAAGGTHNVPSWHHYGIQERIDFLLAAQRSPDLIASHHRKTYRSLYVYLALLIGISLYYFL